MPQYVEKINNLNKLGAMAKKVQRTVSFFPADLEFIEARGAKAGRKLTQEIAEIIKSQRLADEAKIVHDNDILAIKMAVEGMQRLMQRQSLE